MASWCRAPPCPRVPRDNNRGGRAHPQRCSRPPIDDGSSGDTAMATVRQTCAGGLALQMRFNSVHHGGRSRWIASTLTLS